jgi:hypothetical protein
MLAEGENMSRKSLDDLIATDEWTQDDMHVHFGDFVAHKPGVDWVDVAKEGLRIYDALTRYSDPNSAMDELMHAVAAGGEAAMAARLARILGEDPSVIEAVLEWDDNDQRTGMDGLTSLIAETKAFQARLDAGEFRR